MQLKCMYVRVAMVEGVGSHANWTALLPMPSNFSGWPLMASNLLFADTTYWLYAWVVPFGQPFASSSHRSFLYAWVAPFGQLFASSCHNNIWVCGWLHGSVL